MRLSKFTGVTVLVLGLLCAPMLVQAQGPGPGPGQVQNLSSRVAALEAAVFSVLDANDNKVGNVLGTGDPNVAGSHAVTVGLRQGGRAFAIVVQRSGFRGISSLFFESADCSGAPFVRILGGVLPSVAVASPGNTVYIEDTAASPQSLLSRSFIRSGETTCTVSNNTFLLTPAIVLVNMDDLFTPPFSFQ